MMGRNGRPLKQRNPKESAAGYRNDSSCQWMEKEALRTVWK